MRLAIYKKIFGGPEPININGKIIIVNSGQSIIADAQSMMGKRGFSFVRFYNDVPETLSVQPFPQIKADINQPQFLKIEEVDIQEITIDNDEITSPNEEVKSEEPKNTRIGFSDDILTELKSYSNRKWITMKKAEVKKILKDANIDFEHIQDERWKLIAFLKDLINSI